MRPRGGSGGRSGGVNQSAASVVVAIIEGNARVLGWESELDKEVKLDEEVDVHSVGG